MEAIIRLIEYMLRLVTEITSAVRRENKNREINEIRKDPIGVFMDTFNPKNR